MKRIALDMDGVLADEFGHFADLYEKEKGIRILPEQAQGKKLLQAFPGAGNYIHQPGFFRNSPVIPGSREVVEKLFNTYDLYIVSAAVEYPQSLTEKLEWLKEHFPFIPWQKIVFCGTKDIVSADIMIDDNFKNLDPFSGQTLLFSQPHNYLADPGRHRRVTDWFEIETILL
ncbi:5' nucleotidase, NT5C type [Flavihumibacter fluvii]|uniref:5' nucleotidase, NT5C type n=1 Tax=Flavihumibacter fluvii TaxID=2838157 RepID=UPI001BDF63D1|nr:5'(3')-deoxyribonucleotidase [Flavihumibacter fluvii]ULQ50615.1 5'(3')-deoxyribonucleotidase [Flavihumibacter fluvii]